MANKTRTGSLNDCRKWLRRRGFSWREEEVRADLGYEYALVGWKVIAQDKHNRRFVAEKPYLIIAYHELIQLIRDIEAMPRGD